jgi:site-specific DNA recombinase
MKKALGYIRVSSEEQADHGLGLESQRQRIKAYCEMKGLDLATDQPFIRMGSTLN